MQEQADAAMIDAIEWIEDMTLDDYRTVFHAARANPELAVWLIELYYEQTGR